MTERDDVPRLYGEREMGEILKRATELQEEESVAAARVSGLTLRELQEVAAEAGIDPRHLQRAALELEGRVAPGSDWEAVAGAPVTLVMERTVRGELLEVGFERLVELLQQLTGSQGQPSLVGHTLTWREVTPSNTRTLQVLVSSRDGETRIRIEERLHQLAGGLFGGIMGGVGGGVGLGVGLPVGIALLGSPLFAVAWPVGILGLSYMTARGIFQARSKARQRALATLLEDLTRAVADVRDDGPPHVGGGPSGALPPGSSA